jgi:hypothetical protein
MAGRVFTLRFVAAAILHKAMKIFNFGGKGSETA